MLAITGPDNTELLVPWRLLDIYWILTFALYGVWRFPEFQGPRRQQCLLLSEHWL
jgi:hypothetical protein